MKVLFRGVLLCVVLVSSLAFSHALLTKKNEPKKLSGTNKDEMLDWRTCDLLGEGEGSKEIKYPKDFRVFKGGKSPQFRLSNLWAQQYIGLDLLDELIPKLKKRGVVFHRPTAQILDSTNSGHGFSVYRLLADQKVGFGALYFSGPSFRGNPAKPFFYLNTLGNFKDYTKSYKKEIERMKESGGIPDIVAISMGEIEEQVYEKVLKPLTGKNTIFMIAGGNEYPRSEAAKRKYAKDVMFVGSLSPGGFPSSFSSEYPGISILAPSDRFLRSKDKDGKYNLFSGTSGAQPLAAGAVAAIRAILPSASRTDVETILRVSALRVPSTYQKPQLNGAGLINVPAILEVAADLQIKCRKNTKPKECLSKEIKLLKPVSGKAKEETLNEKLAFFPGCLQNRKTPIRYAPSCKILKDYFDTIRIEAHRSVTDPKAWKAVACIHDGLEFKANGNFYRLLGVLEESGLKTALTEQFKSIGGEDISGAARVLKGHEAESMDLLKKLLMKGLENPHSSFSSTSNSLTPFRQAPNVVSMVRSMFSKPKQVGYERLANLLSNLAQDLDLSQRKAVLNGALKLLDEHTLGEDSHFEDSAKSEALKLATRTLALEPLYKRLEKFAELLRKSKPSELRYEVSKELAKRILKDAEASVLVENALLSKKGGLRLLGGAIVNHLGSQSKGKYTLSQKTRKAIFDRLKSCPSGTDPDGECFWMLSNLSSGEFHNLDAKIVNELIRIANLENNDSRLQGEYALKTLFSLSKSPKEEIQKILAKHLNGKNPDRQLDVILAISHSKGGPELGKKFGPRIFELWKRQNRNTRGMYLEALGSVGFTNKELTDKMLKIIRAKRGDVDWMGAVEYATKLGLKSISRDLSQLIRKRYRNGDGYDVRTTALKALFKLDPKNPEREMDLKWALRDPSFSVAALTFEILEKRNSISTPVYEELLLILKDTESLSRSSARSLILKKRKLLEPRLKKTNSETKNPILKYELEQIFDTWREMSEK